MRERIPRHGRLSGRDGMAGLALAAIAVGCCFGLPLVAALASSVAIGAILGVVAAVLALVVAVGGSLLLRRRREAVAPGRPDAEAEGDEGLNSLCSGDRRSWVDE